MVPPLGVGALRKLHIGYAEYGLKPVAVPVFRRRYTAPAGGKVRQIQKQQQKKSEHVIYLWKAEILLIRTM